MEPPDHEIVPKTSSNIQGSFDCASALFKMFPICSLNNNITPPKPMINPKMVALLLRFSGQCGLSSTTNQIGAEDTNIATIALGKVCSDQITMPFATNSNNTPVIEAVMISFAEIKI